MSEKFEVVISGISGRFPECDDLDTYKRMLYNKENPITYDNRKWPVGYKYKFGEETVPLGTGKFTEIQRFDARVFACSSMLANCTDIINRKTLEPSFEAILDAGINPASLMGANIGCYMSSTINEVESIKIFSRVGGKMYLIGGSKAMLSNRISFALNLTGPSYTYYSGVLGGLEALSAAYQNIVEGRIDAAIVGSSSSIIDPKLSLNFLRLGYLSPDALCRALDADADGYGRSEGAVLMFLQRAQDAKRSYGTLKFSDCFYMGLSPHTFLGYDEHVLETSLREIYSKYDNVKPSDVSFVEMDACGVKRLDELESEAVATLFCPGRIAPLLVGSVKSHSGHAEGAAALLSLIKALFALDSGYIAPNMHFSKPNPKIKPLVDGRLKVVSETTKLPGSIVAVNSQNLFGLVSHAVIKQNPKENRSQDTEEHILPRLVLLCGRTEDGVREVLKKIEEMPLNKEFIAMTNEIFKTPITTHLHRGYTILPTSPNASNSVDVVGDGNRPVWFLFSGMGSQWNGMGKGLMDIPIFAAAVDKCEEVLKPRGIDIRHILTSDDPCLFDNIVHAFVGIITVQIGLVNIMKAIGIEPDGIIGHSVGENACAYADGCLTLEQSVLASYARGMASNEAETIKGMMAAIGRGYEQIRDSLPEGVEVACHNSADNCTLTGPAELVTELVEKLRKENIFARAVNVSNIAYHSRHIASAAPILLKRLNEVIKIPKQRSSRWISTSVPETDWDMPLAKICSAEYLTNNLVSPVLFEEGCRHIPENAIVIEIAPHGLLQAILKRSLNKSCTNIPLTLRSKQSNSVNFLLSAIGKTFIAGCQPDVNALYPKIEFPVPRGTPSTSLLATWDHSEPWDDVQPVKDKALSEEVIQVKLNEGSKFSYIRGHRVKDQNVIPLSLYLFLTWHMLSILKNEKMDSKKIIFENIKVLRNLRITLEKSRDITIMIQHGSGDFEILLENRKNPEKPKLIVTGTVQFTSENINSTDIDISSFRTMHRLTGRGFYQHLKAIGFQLDSQFSNIQELAFSNTDYFGKLTWNKNWVCFLDSLMKMHMYFDLKKKELLFPTRIRRIAIDAASFETLKSGDEIMCHTDSITQKTQCKGLEMVDLRCNHPTSNTFLSTGKTTTIRLQSMRFISHADPQLQDKSAFFGVCLQLAVENAVSALGPEGKVEIFNATNSVLDSIKSIVKRSSYLKPNVVFANCKHSTDTTKSIRLMIVNNFDELDKLRSQIKIMPHLMPHSLFVLVFTSANEAVHSVFPYPFVEVTKQTFDDTNMYFYKVIEINKPPPMVLTGACQLRLEMNKHPVVLLKQNIETDDLNAILSKQKSNVRYMFMMDDDAPNFSIENPIYRNQIQLGLPVSILKNGQWGTYRYLENDLEPKSPDKLSAESKYSQLRLRSVDLKFVNNETAPVSICNHDNPVYDIEYSGSLDSGQKVMGLGKCTSTEPIFSPDSCFTWVVPQDWSLEDACTVPLIYLQVYKSFILIDCKEYKRSILINSENLSFTEACIAVSLHNNYKTYATVSSNADANLLTSKFPSLDKSHLLTQDGCRYQIELKHLTKGKGVDISINCNSRSDHVEAVTNCMSLFGKCIQVGVDDTEQYESQLGLFVFLKSVSVSFVPKSATYFLGLPANTKQQLSIMLEDGIRDGVVKPLSRTVWNQFELVDRSQETSKIKRICECVSVKNTENKMKGKLQCDDSRSFIIVASGKKPNLWIELVEWLVEQGAKKFIIALDNISMAPKLSHQINRLLVQKKATIILTTSKRAGTVTDARNLITEANSLAPLEAIFFVSVAKLGAVIGNMDRASRRYNPAHFVCLFSEGLKECEDRRSNGLSAVLIHSKNSISKFSIVASQLKLIFNQLGCSNSPVLYELVDTSNNEGENMSGSLSHQLSMDLKQLEDIGLYSTITPEFTEVVSLSKKYSESKNVYPVFIIPSINAEFMKPLIMNLLYPTFCATFTENCGSASEYAHQLLEALLKIQPSGPVTIIGETWSGSVSIELASLLQSTKRSVQLFLIEGNPSTWQNHIKVFGDIDRPQFDHHLLETMLNITEKLNKGYHANEADWKDILQRYLKSLKLEEHSKANIIKAVTGIRNRLIMTAKYISRGERLKHVILFKQRPSDNTMEKYSFSDEVHLFKEEKYQDFLKIREMARIINDNALFCWWP